MIDAAGGSRYFGKFTYIKSELSSFSYIIYGNDYFFLIFQLDDLSQRLPFAVDVMYRALLSTEVRIISVENRIPLRSRPSL